MKINTSGPEGSIPTPTANKLVTPSEISRIVKFLPADCREDYTELYTLYTPRGGKPGERGAFGDLTRLVSLHALIIDELIKRMDANTVAASKLEASITTAADKHTTSAATLNDASVKVCAAANDFRASVREAKPSITLGKVYFAIAAALLLGLFGIRLIVLSAVADAAQDNQGKVYDEVSKAIEDRYAAHHRPANTPPQ